MGEGGCWDCKKAGNQEILTKRNEAIILRKTQVHPVLSSHPAQRKENHRKLGLECGKGFTRKHPHPFLLLQLQEKHLHLGALRCLPLETSLRQTQSISPSMVPNPFHGQLHLPLKTLDSTWAPTLPLKPQDQRFTWVLTLKICPQVPFLSVSWAIVALGSPLFTESHRIQC